MSDGFVGVISDTHGLVRPQALEALRGAELILHAGDIGKPEVLESLHALAPVCAIKGNVDGDWASALAERLSVEVFGRRAYLLHSLQELELKPAGQFDMIISGHSHQPACYREDGVLYLNPGSAGPRRFSLPVAVARICVKNGELEAELVELEV